MAPLFLMLYVPLKWASTSANPTAQRRYEPTLHAIFLSGTDAATNQSIDRIYSASGI